jgi:hypothetical protein
MNTRIQRHSKCGSFVVFKALHEEMQTRSANMGLGNDFVFVSGPFCYSKNLCFTLIIFVAVFMAPSLSLSLSPSLPLSLPPPLSNSL